MFKTGDQLVHPLLGKCVFLRYADSDDMCYPLDKDLENREFGWIRIIGGSEMMVDCAYLEK